MRPESHGNKPGFVVDRDDDEVRTLLGEFHRLNGTHEPTAPAPRERDEEPAETADVAPAGETATSAAATAVRKRTRRGSRGGRSHRGGRGRKKTTAGGAAAD